MFTFCAAISFEIYHKTSGGPRQCSPLSKMHFASKRRKVCARFVMKSAVNFESCAATLFEKMRAGTSDGSPLKANFGPGMRAMFHDRWSKIHLGGGYVSMLPPQTFCGISRQGFQHKMSTKLWCKFGSKIWIEGGQGNGPTLRCLPDSTGIRVKRSSSVTFRQIREIAVMPLEKDNAH